MVKRFVAALLLMTVPAMAQTPLPDFSTVSPVIATDVNRVAAELTVLLKIAQDAEARAAYWQNACKSTPECGGKP